MRNTVPSVKVWGMAQIHVQHITVRLMTLGLLRVFELWIIWMWNNPNALQLYCIMIFDLQKLSDFWLETFMSTWWTVYSISQMEMFCHINLNKRNYNSVYLSIAICFSQFLYWLWYAVATLFIKISVVTSPAQWYPPTHICKTCLTL